MDKTNILASIVFFLFIFSGVSSAMAVQDNTFSDVNIYRLYPESAYIGQKIWITLSIENTGASDKTISISEQLGNAAFDQNGTEIVNTTYGNMYFYKWELQLSAGENTSLSYWIEPKSAGNYVITPASVNIDGMNYRMKSASIVVTCFVDSKCDASAGENFLNCPPDCLSGSADGVCDAVSDSKCDPDCAVDVDSDCAVTQPAKENITTPVNETKELPNATNITPPIAPTQPGTKSTSSTGGFDFKANAIYIVGITVVAIVLYFLLRRKKSPT